ncbi:family 76 glycosyl hydrolase [Plectosphaerella plurivora]|uniref:Mannan endo-1,6-alpha-mannosidase n=1 Tax=Plectosphaerella plurivora TaxID=936078 RepID=A0A9P8VBH5_9PEZI|nr:family 76 glycosyl hydrolase [Plectosphaerella plurivora]
MTAIKEPSLTIASGSIKTIARSMAEDLMSFYKGDQPGQVPGLLPDPYYWWEAGALMGAMIDYYYYTGDDQWNDVVIQALLHQVGDHDAYMPENQTLTEGNDDQGFWGLAVMSAAEQNFPNPPADQPQYLTLAQGVFNTQAARWDTQNCNGGLRWQIFTWNKGYDYKNTISQGCFFALAARLALYTGNSSYADWAERAWDWTRAVNFIDDRYYVFDGAHITTNCTNIVPYQWSYNAGVFINGASAMYKFTGSDLWKERLVGLVNGSDVFFVGPERNIMQEVACETVELCNTDQKSFKAYLSRWLAATTRWAPFLTDRIMAKLQPSSVAAARQCTGGDNGRMCGLKWTENGTWDGTTGVGQQMMAMQVVLSNLVGHSRDAVTQGNGGTSQGDPSAGGGEIGRSDPVIVDFPPPTAGSIAGASILTALLIIGWITLIVWMFMDETSEKPLKQRFFDFRKSLLNGGGIVALPGCMIIGAAVLGDEVLSTLP